MTAPGVAKNEKKLLCLNLWFFIKRHIQNVTLMLKNENNTFLDKQIVLVTLGPLPLDGYIEQINSSKHKLGWSDYPCSSKGAPHIAGGGRATLKRSPSRLIPPAQVFECLPETPVPLFCQCWLAAFAGLWTQACLIAGLIPLAIH